MRARDDDARAALRRAASRSTSRYDGVRAAPERHDAPGAGARELPAAAASSAFTTATRGPGRARRRSPPFARDVGLATRRPPRRARRRRSSRARRRAARSPASAAISPRTLIPISSTANVWCASRPRTTAGMPIRLFRFPAVAWHGASRRGAPAAQLFRGRLPGAPGDPYDARRLDPAGATPRARR